MIVVMKMALPWLVRMGMMLVRVTVVGAIGVVAMGMDAV
jgi:hypothetical protein